MKKWMAFATSTMVIVLDQLTKQWIFHTLLPYQPKAIGPLLNLMLAFNTGSAFSFLSQAGPWHHWFFLGFSFLMSGVMIIWIWRLSETARLQRIALALILGGALGNFIDRLVFGYVIDFIQVYYKTYYWPVFNLADSAICIGAGLLILEIIITSKRAKTGSIS